MLLIVGLGNKGEKYEHTRHNIGFMVVDALFKNITTPQERWKSDNRSNSLIYKAGDLLLVKPHTLMNASGYAVSRLKSFYKVDIQNVWVIHDDIDLPLGKLRIKKSGGTAGHKGLESIIAQLGSGDFLRFRVGVGRDDVQMHANKELKTKLLQKYVLSTFTEAESARVHQAVKKTVKAIESAIDKGLDKTMNQYN